MPRRPKGPCSFPGCPNLTDGRYCEEHKKQANRSYEKYGRDKVVRRRYGRAWKRIRDSYVKTHPFCELCFEKGIIVPVDEVHHKKPLSEGGSYSVNFQQSGRDVPYLFVKSSVALNLS